MLIKEHPSINYFPILHTIVSPAMQEN